MGKNQIIAELREENQRLAIDNLDTYDKLREARSKLEVAHENLRRTGRNFEQVEKERDEYKQVSINTTKKLVEVANEKNSIHKELIKAKVDLGREKAKRLISEKDADAIRNDEYNAHREATIRELADQSEKTSRALRNLFNFDFNASNDHAGALKQVYGRLSTLESERNDYKASLKAIRIALGFSGETTSVQVIGRIEGMKTKIANLERRLANANSLNLEYGGRIASLELNAGVGTDYEQLVDTNHKLVDESEYLRKELAEARDKAHSDEGLVATITERLRVLNDKIEQVNDINDLVNEHNTFLRKENDRLSSLVDEAEKRLLDLWVHASVTNKWVKDEKNMFPWLKGWVKAFGYEYESTTDSNYVVKALNRKFGTKASLANDILGSEA